MPFSFPFLINNKTNSMKPVFSTCDSLFGGQWIQKMLILSMILIGFGTPPNASAIINSKLPSLYVANDVPIQVNGYTMTLRAGTAVVVEAAQNFDSKNLSAGQTLNLRVKYNVVSERKNLISAGALAIASVSSVTKAGFFGKAGRIELIVQSIQAVDAQQVPVSGIPLVIEGDDKKMLAWGVAIGVGLFTYGIGLLLGFAFKGKSAELKAGTTINAAVASDVEVDPSRH
jgi:hypothetical protein